MKKKILLRLLLLVTSPFYVINAVSDHSVPDEQFCQKDFPCDEEEEYMEFFAISDDDVEYMAAHQPKKEQWSYARILAIRMGVAMALIVRDCCSTINRLWHYLRSWVPV